MNCAFPVSPRPIFSTRYTTRWIGWTAIAFGILFVTPAEVVGAAGLLIWTLIVSFLVYRASTVVLSTLWPRKSAAPFVNRSASLASA